MAVRAIKVELLLECAYEHKDEALKNSIEATLRGFKERPLTDVDEDEVFVIGVRGLQILGPGDGSIPRKIVISETLERQVEVAVTADEYALLEHGDRNTPEWEALKQRVHNEANNRMSEAQLEWVATYATGDDDSSLWDVS